MKKSPIIFAFLVLFGISVLGDESKPNVIIVISDDQGYGDVGAHGHPFIRTPNMDKLAAESVHFTNFHVAPVCTPTRSQLLTGVDAMKNGATHPAAGRSMLRRDIPTLANYFGDAGYKTILSGKWHLGDSYPYRPEDRGFHELLSFRAWGVPSMASHWDNSYANENNDVNAYTHPTLLLNGVDKKYEGYVTDILFDHAMEQMKICQEAKQPFFLYLPTPTPHHPNLAPEKNLKYYQNVSREWKTRSEKKVDIPYYGMIGNIDDNLGRLDQFLAAQGLKDNTILLFLTDNGTQSRMAMNLYNAGMKGNKGKLFEGGHRVPLTVRWKNGNLKHGRKVDTLTQVQDLCPTLLSLCGIKPENLYPQDGQDLGPLLKGEKWVHGDRVLFVGFDKLGDEAVMQGPWRLVMNRLYNVDDDLIQSTDVSEQYPEVRTRLKTAYKNWLAETKPEYSKIRYIDLGHPRALTTILYSNDWDGDFCDNPYHLVRSSYFGTWHVKVVQEGNYRIELSRWPFESGKALTEGQFRRPPDGSAFEGDWRNVGKVPIASASLQVGDVQAQAKAQPQATHVTFEVHLPEGEHRLRTVFHDAAGEELCSAHYVRVTLIKAEDRRHR